MIGDLLLSVIVSFFAGAQLTGNHQDTPEITAALQNQKIFLDSLHNSYVGPANLQEKIPFGKSRKSTIEQSGNSKKGQESGDAELEALIRDCKIARKKKDWKTLELKSRQLIQLVPGNDRYKLYLAVAYQELGATRHLKQLLALMSDRAPAEVFVSLGDLQFRDGEVLDAIKSFRRAIRNSPESKQAHLRLGFCLSMLLWSDELIKECRRAIQKGAASDITYVYLISKDWLRYSNGSEKNKRWNAKYRGQSELFAVAELVHRSSFLAGESSKGKNNGDRSKTKKIQEEVKQLLKKYPRNRELLVCEISRYIELGNVEVVVELLKSGGENCWTDNRFWRFKGWVHSRNTEWETAESCYRKCLELNPYDWRCRQGLQNVYRQTGRDQQADAMAKSSKMGKSIMRDIFELEDTSDIPSTLMKSIADYLQICGDETAAIALKSKLAKEGK